MFDAAIELPERGIGAARIHTMRFSSLLRGSAGSRLAPPTGIRLLPV
jgi:hypothetical protein